MAEPMGEFAKLSIIIPTYNEEQHIERSIARLLESGATEIIVADGRSSDETREIAAASGARVVCVPSGRGPQMNAGAAAATGDVFLFLHADTRLPHDYFGHIRETLSAEGVSAGAFDLRIDAPNRSLRLVEFVVHWRSRLLQLPYGDQTLFLTRAMFERAGGFPKIPVMEDFDFVRRLRRLGRVRIAGASVQTSARRWMANGIWRTTLLNQICVAAFHLGVKPHTIARMRGVAAQPRRAAIETSTVESTEILD